MTAESIPALASSTLSSAINNSTTTIPVTSRSSFPQSGNFRINIENEIMVVTGGQGTGAGSFTVSTRAAVDGGTAPAAHSSGVAVYGVITPTSLASQTWDEAHLSIADNTTADVSTSAHGFTPKAPNDTAKFLRGDASWAAPPGGGGYSALYGTGADGALAMDGSGAVAGCTLSGGNYTLTRNIYASSITQTQGVTLFTANFKVFCSGTWTTAGSGTATVDNSGNAAVAGAGGTATTAGSISSNRAGRAGGVSANGSNGLGTTASHGGSGGAGGNGSSATGGTAGNAVAPTGTDQSGQNILTWMNTGAPQIGAGGDGGGGGGNGGTGGGGGAGGGALLIFVKTLTTNGTCNLVLQSKGGNGANGVSGDSGGGGGGGGGVVSVISSSISAGALPSGVTSVVTGGTKGNAVGAGTNTNAANGSSGSTIVFAN